MGMIDKLELRLPRVSLFQAPVREFMAESRFFENSTRTMGSGRYEWVTNLHPVGIDALLHFSLKREERDPHEGEHKLELQDTGKKRYSDLVAQIERTVEYPADELEVMRIDLCADIYEVPVEWFLPRVRVKYKRVAYQMGNLKYQLIGKQGIQTITAGKRPNIVRIYDKVAEYEYQLKKLKRKQSYDADELTLKSEFGISESATITRVERQFGGGRIPVEIDRFGKLINLPDFDPFSNLEVENGSGATMPTLKECGLDRWLTGTRLRQMKEDMGVQQFRRWMSANSGGNGARYLKRYSDFLQLDADRKLTRESLYETYRASVEMQLAA
jgi:hypothetical protein